MTITTTTNEILNMIDDDVEILFDIDIYNDNFTDYFTNNTNIYTDLEYYIEILSEISMSQLVTTAAKCIQQIINKLKDKVIIYYNFYIDEYQGDSDCNDILQNLNITDNNLKQTLIIFENKILEFIM
jgi:hypothetical protein